MGLDLFKLQVFVTVVDRGGYSAAAEHLGLSQATVSFHMQSLERQLAATLLRYDHRVLHLTPAGQQVYRSAQAMLQEQRRLTRIVGGQHSEQVRVGVSMAFEQAFFFEKVVAPYRQAHQDVLLSLRFGHSVGLAEAVLDHELDLAYVIGWHVPSSLRYEPLHRAEFTFFVAPEHPLAGREMVAVDDVAKAGVIAATLDRVEWAHYEDVLSEVGLGSTDVVLEVDGVQARVLAAQAGLGVFGTFRPPYVGADAYPGLVPLRLGCPAPSVEIGTVRRRGETPAACVHEFDDWLGHPTENANQ
jgi:DNA-binding transcriptional LysR family regulator